MTRDPSGGGEAPAPGEFTMIADPTDLRARVRMTGSGTVDEDAIRRAENALKQLSSHFGEWMETEMDRLANARARMRAEGLHPELRREMFRVAHDIRGEAGTLGYPMAGRVAESLAGLLEADEIAGVPFDLVEHHVDAVRAIVREAARHDADLAESLAVGLEGLTRDFVERHRRGASNG